MPHPRPLPAGLGFALFTLAFAGGAPAVPVQWRVADGGNGHFYDWFSGANVASWEAARDAAAARSHLGVQGHLATVTSAAEQSFVAGVPGPLFDVYLGGVQARDSAAPDQGWSWVTGEPWGFTFWDPRLPEPTDGIGSPSPENNEENYLMMWSRFSGSVWNDYSGAPGLVAAYVVEYPVPEPSSAAGALMVGALVLLRRTRRTRR